MAAREVMSQPLCTHVEGFLLGVDGLPSAAAQCAIVDPRAASFHQGIVAPRDGAVHPLGVEHCVQDLVRRNAWGFTPSMAPLGRCRSVSGRRSACGPQSAVICFAHDPASGSVCTRPNNSTRRAPRRGLASSAPRKRPRAVRPRLLATRGAARRSSPPLRPSPSGRGSCPPTPRSATSCASSSRASGAPPTPAAASSHSRRRTPSLPSSTRRTPGAARSSPTASSWPLQAML